MAFSINTNTVAFEAAQNLQLTTQDFVTAVQRLSSGLRINSAADDPAGLALSNTLLSQSSGFDQVQRNMQDGVSLLQTAQSGLNQTQAALQRIDQLAIQAANDTLTLSDRQNIQSEIVGLVSEIDQIAQQTQYNKRSLLNGSAGGAIVSGGGPDLTDVQAQAGVVPNGASVTVTAATQATLSAIQGGAAPASSTFAGGGSITISGPGGASQTFSSFTGEAVSTFIQQVNSAGIGVTASTAAGGQVQLTSNSFGLNNATNATGSAAITATGNGADADFGSGAGGAALQLITTGGGGGLAGVATGAGTFNAGATAANATVTVSVNGTSIGATTLSGANSDQFAGRGAAAGISFRVLTPGTIAAVPTDAFSVKQNVPLQMQVGANASQTIAFSIDAQTSQALGVNAIDVTSQAGAESAITAVQGAISQLSSTQANLGALQNRLTDTQNLAGSQEQNLITARSNLVDANIPQETVRFTRDQILIDAGTAILAQANQAPSGLLSLLTSTGTGH